MSAARPTTRLSSLLARLRLDSIRNRYLAVALLFVVSMVGAGGYAERIATQATQLGAVHAGERQEIRALLRNLTNDMWAAETTLHGYLLGAGRDATPATATTAQSFTHAGRNPDGIRLDQQ